MSGSEKVLSAVLAATVIGLAALRSVSYEPMRLSPAQAPAANITRQIDPNATSLENTEKLTRPNQDWTRGNHAPLPAQPPAQSSGALPPLAPSSFTNPYSSFGAELLATAPEIVAKDLEESFADYLTHTSRIGDPSVPPLVNHSNVPGDPYQDAFAFLPEETNAGPPLSEYLAQVTSIPKF